ncbi:hypothetical protein [Clostridium perfringens]|uniref:hypothetical protein n=1 Tax=Clostridium perfringens TaxID=1502 RepID=UPI000D70EFC5|nr:hypothetical protein [Clostridium perfringens]PWX20919.1 hypothetical protein CYK64_09445 [Clostridium perfringens]TPG00082.1 hypothetical protein CBI46_09955 [Clostridium perfringens A]
MLRERDYNILRFIEKYKAISLKNACRIFFTGEYKSEEYRYRVAARRLQKLENKGILQSYRNSYTDEKIYYTNKKLSPHSVFIQDFWRKLLELDFNVLEFNTNVSLMNGQLKPDAFVLAKYDDILVNYFLEVDLNHYTDKSKLIRYEMFYKSDELTELCGTRKPCLIITRPTHSKDIRLTSKLFDTVYTDLKYTNLERFLFED